MNDNKLSMALHFKELRKRLLIILITIFIMTTISFICFKDFIMNIAIAPITKLHHTLFFLGVSEAFLAYMKLSLLAGIIFASPIIIWQILAFILPGLYKNEKVVLLVTSISGAILFISGILFSYFFVIEAALRIFLISFSGSFQALITTNHYLNFLLKFLLPFGLTFEVPLIIFLLAKVNLVTSSKLKIWRKYIIIIFLIIAAILTPPDVVSQILLTLPMYSLYEISIIIVKIVEQKKNLYKHIDK